MSSIVCQALCWLCLGYQQHLDAEGNGQNGLGETIGGDRYSKGTRTTATLVGQKVQMSMKQFDQKIDKSDIKRHLKAIKMGLIRSSVHGSSSQMADQSSLWRGHCHRSPHNACRFEQQAKGAGRPGSKDGLVKIKHQKNTAEITAARKLISILTKTMI